MFIGIITLLTALAISAVAIYYSVAGLAAIFAAAVIPIIIMGVVLEIGKLVTAVWLHKYWSRATWWLKTYLSIAVFVLMFITSMGIFGFLSKAHIEQTSLSTEQVALIETLDDKEARAEAKIQRWNDEMNRLMKGEDVRVDNLVEREQNALKDLYAQIEKEKDNARLDADKQIKLQNDRLDQARQRKESDIKAAQDRYAGAFSKAGLDEAIEQAKKNELSVASSAQREIRNINKTLNDRLAEIDKKYADDIQEINDRIQKLRNQANTKTVDIDSRINELEQFIDKEQKVIDTVREEKLVYEKTYRKLEAEVGPIKYIAEFIYGDNADNNMLEEAVRWVIIVIIFVFDPLAVLLLIASQYTFRFNKEDKDGLVPPPIDQDPKGPEDDRGKDSQDQEEGTETPSEPQNEESIQGQDETDTTVAGTSEEERPELVSFTDEEWEEAHRENYEFDRAKKIDENIPPEIGESEPKYTPTRNPIFWNKESDEIKKKALNTGLSEESSQPRPRYTEAELDALEENLEWKKAKQKWKEDNPELTVKQFKDRYIKGLLNELPWEKYLENTETSNHMNRTIPNLTEVIEPEGYSQNSEQNNNTLWNRIRNDKN